MIRKKISKPITTIEMELAIAQLFGIRQCLIVPNVSWGFNIHECDLLIVRKSNVAIEVEIKRTKADLLNDFKKRHGHLDRKNRIAEFYYAMPESLYLKCKDLIPEDSGVIICNRRTRPSKKDAVYASYERRAKKKKGYKKISEEDRVKLSRLGSMRIWSLKNKIITLQNKLKKKQ